MSPGRPHRTWSTLRLEGARCPVGWEGETDGPSLLPPFGRLQLRSSLGQYSAAIAGVQHPVPPVLPGPLAAAARGQSPAKEKENSGDGLAQAKASITLTWPQNTVAARDRILSPLGNTLSRLQQNTAAYVSPMLSPYHEAPSTGGSSRVLPGGIFGSLSPSQFLFRQPEFNQEN